MSNKFGWQKANARDAARRSATGTRYSRKRRRRRELSPTFVRYSCTNCQSFRVTQVVGHGFRCDACGRTSKTAAATEVQRVGRTQFKRI